MCAYVGVCTRERERERERKNKREREREREKKRDRKREKNQIDNNKMFICEFFLRKYVLASV